MDERQHKLNAPEDLPPFQVPHELEERVDDSENKLRHKHHQAALAHKEKLRKRRRIIKWIGGAVVVLALLYLAPIPLGSMTVTGSKTVSIEDVKVAGNIKDPVNILQINRERLKQRLSHDLRVDSVDISYRFPLTMEVAIKERVPLMVLPAQFGYLTIDRQGQVIDSSDSLKGLKVPLVSGLGAGNLLLGDWVTDPAMKAAVTYLDALPADYLAQLEEINLGDGDQLLAYTTDGVQIRIGNQEQLKEKAEMTVNMLKDLQDKHVRAQYIDVNLDAPYVKELK